MVELEDSYGGGDYVPTKTNWYEKGVPTMWYFVNQQLDAHYNQAHGWKMATELTSLYHSRLNTYRESFVSEWRNSPAQEAFIIELDKLIASMKNTTDIASANYSASVDIPNALYEAKSNLEKIVQDYTAAETDQGKINRGEMDPPEEGKPTPADIMNDKKYSAAPIMYELSRQLVRAQQSMIQPAPYVGPGRQVNDGTDNGSPNLPPAIVPPVMPMPPPPPTPPGPTAPLPTPVAPDLSGLQPGQRPPTTPGIPAPMQPMQPITPTPGLIGPMPPTGRPPTGPMAPRPPLTTQGMPGLPVGGGPRGPSAMPPGGVIGGQPGAPGAAGARGAGARPMPPGGMINPAGAGGAGRGGMGAPGAPGAPGRGGAPMGGAPGRPGSGQHGDEDGENFDPDTQWHVAQGVAPVVDTPDAPGVINPGPAIGLDR